MRNLSDRDQDAAICETDSDAAIARLSAVTKKYLHDPFISLFISQPQFIPSRPPLINWGTYIRSTIIDDLIIDWARSITPAETSFQILSLGAGSDTRFWRLANGLLRSNEKSVSNCSRYLEIDFPEMVRKKVAVIKRHSTLHSVLGDFTVAESGTSLTSHKYIVQGADLRNIADFSKAIELLDKSLPTLVISECVLVYMTKAQSDALLRHLTDTHSCIGAVIYEMYGLKDDFGRVMKSNLKARGLTLPGIDAYATLNDQVSRFLQTGFTRGQALSLKTLRYQCIDAEERHRLSKLEFLDEVEELDLVLDHYAISWGFKTLGPFESLLREGNMDWGVKPKMTTLE